MTHSIAEPDLAEWRRYCEAHRSFLEASHRFFTAEIDRAAVVREALRTGTDKFTSFDVISRMRPDELMPLFDLLVEWASTGHGSIQIFRDAILRLPRAWVLARIEEVAEPFLAAGSDDEYRRFLELYEQLDPALTLKLAERAAEHPDEEIREAGQDYLHKAHYREIDVTDSCPIEELPPSRPGSKRFKAS